MPLDLSDETLKGEEEMLERGEGQREGCGIGKKATLATFETSDVHSYGV